MIVAGFGFRCDAGIDSLLEVFTRACGPVRPDALATLEEKADALAPLAARLALPVLRISQAEAAERTTPTPSPAARARFGTGSLAEATALCGAGANARLLAARIVSCDRTATCALAEGETG